MTDLFDANDLWYVGRGAGVTAVVLLSLVMILGILTRAGEPVAGLPRFAISTLHRTTSLSALFFLAIHVVTLYFDPYARLTATIVAVGFLAPYRPFWQGLGTVAMELVVVLIVSSLLRTRLSLRSWRIIHYSAYLCWPITVLHVVGIGTDRSSKWMITVEATCVLAVVSAVVWRLVSRTFRSGTAPAVTIGSV